MQTRLFKTFIYSASALLLLTAAAKLYSATGSVRILTATDPLLHATYRTIMIGMGLLEAAIAFYLLKGRSVMLKPYVIFWLSSNFMLYRFANDWLHIHLCPCLGTVESMLPFSKAQVDFFLMLVVLYMFFGSSYLLLSAWNRRLADSQAAASASGNQQGSPV